MFHQMRYKIAVAIALCCLTTGQLAFAAPVNLWQEMGIISESNIRHVIESPASDATDHQIMLSQAVASGLLETAVKSYQEQIKQHGDNPVLKSGLYYAILLGENPGDYKPKNAVEWKRQQDEFGYGASIQAEAIARGMGARVPFCWRVAAFPLVKGRVGRLAEGIDFANRALALDKDDPFTLRLLALAYLNRKQKGDLEKAAEYAKQVIVLQPENYKGYFYLARAYRAMGNSSAAAEQQKVVDRMLLELKGQKTDIKP